MEEWKSKLTAFDAGLCNMVESLTEMECEPEKCAEHFVIKPNYRKHNDPEFIMALWDAIEGRVGERLISISDAPEKTSLIVRINFYKEPCKEAAFIPKIETENE